MSVIFSQPATFDFIGIYILCGLVASTLIFSAAVLINRSGRKAIETSLRGAIRWAAAAGNIEQLNKLFNCPYFDVESSFDGFTALAAASVNGQRGKFTPASSKYLHFIYQRILI